MDIKELEQKIIEKCLDWVDNEITADQLSLVYKEDLESYHQRIYLAAWNNKDEAGHLGEECAFVYLLRAFTLGDNISLSVDYENTVPTEKLITVLPEIIKTAVSKSH